MRQFGKLIPDLYLIRTHKLPAVLPYPPLMFKVLQTPLTLPVHAESCYPRLNFQ